MQGGLQLITSAGPEADGQRLSQHVPTPDSVRLSMHSDCRCGECAGAIAQGRGGSSMVLFKLMPRSTRGTPVDPW